MKQLRLTPRASFVYYESSKNPEGIGSVSNKYKPSQKLAFCACISSTIRAVIHITFDFHVNYNCFNEPFAVSPYKDLYWDMHGLIFETSIWLLAGSTRFYQKSQTPAPKHRYRLNFKCQTVFEHLIGKLWNAPKNDQKQKSGFARATWFATHTLTSRPTKNAQSY